MSRNWPIETPAMKTSPSTAPPCVFDAPGQVAPYDPIAPTALNFEMSARPVGKIEEENHPALGLDFVTVYPHTDHNSPLYEYNGLSGGGLWELSYVPEIGRAHV